VTELPNFEQLAEALMMGRSEGDEQDDPISALIYGMRAVSLNTAQSICRESPEKISYILQILDTHGSAGLLLPYNRLRFLDSHIDDLPSWWRLLTSIVSAGIPPRYQTSYLSDCISGASQHAAARLATINRLAPERHRDGHNLYPIPVYRPDWTIKEGFRYSVGKQVELPYYDLRTLSWTGWNERAVASSSQEGIVPIHPLAPTKSSALRDLLGRRGVRLAERVEGFLLTSIRTVRTADADFKLPINTWMTSAYRLISRDYYRTSQLMTRVVQAIMDREQPKSWSIQFDRKALWLEGDPSPVIGYIERHLPWSGLGGKLLCAIDFLLDQEQLRRSVRAHGGVSEFLRNYLDCVILPAVRLAARYGVFIEPHLQNVVLAIDARDKIVRAYFRDLDNIYLHAPWAIESRVLDSRFDSTGALQEAALYDCIASFRHALRDAHVSELVLQLDLAALAVPTETISLLSEVASRITNASSQSREDILGRDVLSPSSGVKRLLQMHLTRSQQMIFDSNLGGPIAQRLLEL
jgi:hypothetical protein